MDTDAGSTRAKPDGAAGGVRKRPYDLEDRTLAFARRCRAFVRRLPRTVANAEDAKQLVRASGSVGANYIEANEALSKKDFRMRVKIRKEAKEARYWTRLPSGPSARRKLGGRSRLDCA
jgi:hypothetical protein